MQQPARERPGPDARPGLSEPQALAQSGAGTLGRAGLGAPLGGDQYFLGGVDPADGDGLTGGLVDLGDLHGQLLARRHGAAQQGQGDGAELVVARHRGHGAHGPLPHAHGRPGSGQVADEAVELKHGEAARGPTQVEGARDRLLTRVAALRQVYGRAQPVQLVGDGAGVGLAGVAGAAGLNAQGLPGQGTGQAPPLPGGEEASTTAFTLWAGTRT